MRRCLFRRRRTSTGASRTSRASIPTRGRRTARPRSRPPPTMLELDAAGVAYVGEAGIEIASAPDGIRFEPLPDDHELLYSLVGWDEKFAAHNAAMWTQRAARARAARSRPREAALRAHRELGRRRLALLAPARRRRAREPFHAHRGVRVRLAGARGVLERCRRDRGTAGREGRVRIRPEPLARRRGTSPRTTRGSSATRSSTGSRAASAPRRARSGSRTTSRARVRPRV